MPDRTAIGSPANPRFKAWRSLAAGRDGYHERTLVAGRRLTLELAREDPAAVLACLVPPGWAEPLPCPAGTPVFELSGPLFKELDQSGTHHPLLEVSVAGRVAALPDMLEPGLHVALPFQDPLNLGAVIRSAVGLAASGVILLPGSCSPFHPKAIRTSAGAVFRARLRAATDLVSTSAARFPLLTLDATGRALPGFAFPETFVLLVGQEGPGVHPFSRADATSLSVPMDGIESYNAGAAAAMAMYEWRRGRPPCA